MPDEPVVSLIVPVHNEERYIRPCLDSLLANDYPQNRIEVWVVDAQSEDRTRDIVSEYIRQYPHIQLLDNPRKIIPAAFNIGIKNSRGEIILLASGHSIYPSSYISTCVQGLLEHQADNAGVTSVCVPREDTPMGRAIALALAYPFGSGNANTRLGVSFPRFADSVAFGCFRRELFEKIGFYNENLAGSSDMDMNARIKKTGGKIILLPGAAVNYYSDANLKSFWKHNFGDGVWATYVLRFDSHAFAWRHWVPMFFVATVIGSGMLAVISPGFRWIFAGVGGLYILASLAASAHISWRKQTLQYISRLPVVFATRHISHGLGSLLGLLLVLIRFPLWKGRRTASS